MIKSKHLRHRRFSRIRYSDNLFDFLTERQSSLNGTGSGSTFTGAAGTDVTWTAHGKFVGDGPFLLTTTGSLPGNLNLNRFYWISQVVDVNTVKLSTSRDNSNHAVMANAGSGVHTITKASTILSILFYLKKVGAARLKTATDVDNL